MRSFLFFGAFLSLTGGLLSCNKDEDMFPEYFVKWKVDGKEFITKPSEAIGSDYSVQYNKYYQRFTLGADAAEGQSLSFGGMIAKEYEPETIAISGSFVYDGQDYLSPPGTIEDWKGKCTITKIDKTQAEGTFEFDANSVKDGLKMNIVGQFRVKL